MNHTIPSGILNCVRKEVPNVDISTITDIWNELFDYNRRIAEYFKLLQAQSVIDKEPNWQFKAKAYGRVLKTVNEFPVPILSSKQLNNIQGIGDKSKRKIDEIIATCHLGKIEQGDKEKYEIIGAFMKIWGVGHKRAQEFYNYGYRSVDELLNSNINLSVQEQIGVKYYDEFGIRIPRDTMDIIKDKARRLLKQIEPSSILEVVGSYQRGADSSGDVDIIISSDINPQILLKRFVEQLTEDDIITDQIIQGPMKFVGVIRDPENRLHRKLDIWSIPRPSWICALVSLTGPASFIIRLRLEAKKKGLKVSEYNIMDLKTNKKFYPSSEDEYFNILGLKYIPVYDRK